MIQTTSSNPIEPWQLTAFALNELDVSDAANVKCALETDPALRVEFEQIQQTLSAVRTALANTAANVGLSDKQTAIVSSQIKQIGAPNSTVGSEMPAVATIKLAGRPFYRRKRFAVLLATAAAIPLAATWMPSLFENGGPFAVNVPGQTLPSSHYLGDQVSSLREREKELRTELSSTAMLNKAESASPDVGKDLNSNAFAFPAGSEFGQLTNPSEEGGEKMAASGGAVFGGAQLAEVDLPSVPETELVIPMGSKQDVEITKRVIEASKGGNGIASSSVIEAAERRIRISDSLTKAREAKASAVEDSSRRIDKNLSKAGGSSMGGMSGGAMGGGISSGLGNSLGMGASPPKPDNQANNLSASATPMPAAYGLDDLYESLETTAIYDRRLRGVESQSQQLPTELRANAPHLFRAPSSEASSTDRFEKIVETPFLETQKAPLSTFSIDVDTASYSKIRQTIMEGNRLPSPNMVRIEEMVNYFEYGYAGPQDGRPFAAHMSIDRCPWNTEHQLVRVGLQAKKLDTDKRVKANIVFLLDVSGSMNEPNKLPLVKKALSMMVNQLTENDRVAIVVYAGAAGCVLPSTCGAEKHAILSSLEHLNAGGSTNGGQGIQLAYSIAKEQFIPGGANRVVLCTDGDFNVGVTGDDALVAMMQENAKSNIFLTCLGFGAGNYNDSMMEKISNKGNGIYGMIDNELEARRMMVEQLGGTLVTVAKDVKIQVDFNPAKVAGYRLIGYEDRRLANKDFDNDQKDAGEIGAGHRVTALYEVIPVGKWVGIVTPSEGETSKYSTNPKLDSSAGKLPTEEFPSELLTLKVRYKEPEGSVSTKQEFVLKDTDRGDQSLVDRDMQWATSVAEFGLLLRRSEMAPHADWTEMLERASSSAGGDAYRLECLAMMRKARSMFR